WQTGIALASSPLLVSNAVEQRYIDTMVANVEKFGPYIVIGPKIALAHALPQDGVNSLGFSLLLLDEPVSMMGRDVSMLFVLAPIDKSSHFGIMKDLMKIISKEEHLRELENMKCEDVISFFEEITAQEETYDDIQD
ncbi:MAG: PTS sugar transporter subunit IIA, partial [Erysipelotrichaceae bacterium]|nr:PTS sugar transporter subunit IIA [Erysipelotrichaceae bacterium]